MAASQRALKGGERSNNRTGLHEGGRSKAVHHDIRHVPDQHRGLRLSGKWLVCYPHPSEKSWVNQNEVSLAPLPCLVPKVHCVILQCQGPVTKCILRRLPILDTTSHNRNPKNGNRRTASRMPTQNITKTKLLIDDLLRVRWRKQHGPAHGAVGL